MADIIRDASGVERRCGSLPLPANFVSALPPFGSSPEQPLWTDEQIKEVVTDRSRYPARQLFSDAWILDQLSYGSCNGHGLAGCGARARWRRGVRDGLQFSGAYPYSKMNGHRDNGSALADDIEVAQRWGFAPLSLVPATQIYPERQPAGVDAEAAKHKGLQCYRIFTMQGLRTALAAGFDCIVAVMAGNNFSRVDSQGVCGVDRGGGNHAVGCDDLYWDGHRWLYDMFNSWGLKFGQHGRGCLIDEHFAQTFSQHQFVAVPSFDELG